jgi:hypothetical protein
MRALRAGAETLTVGTLLDHADRVRSFREAIHGAGARQEEPAAPDLPQLETVHHPAFSMRPQDSATAATR